MVVAAAILYEPRLSHVKQYITKSITMSTLLKTMRCLLSCRLFGIIPRAMNYQVIIHDAEEGGYWAEVTGMPGCYSQGETLAETKANIQEAAMAWMESQVAMALRKVYRDKSAGKTALRRTKLELVHA